MPFGDIKNLAAVEAAGNAVRDNSNSGAGAAMRELLELLEEQYLQELATIQPQSLIARQTALSQVRALLKTMKDGGSPAI